MTPDIIEHSSIYSTNVLVLGLTAIVMFSVFLLQIFAIHDLMTALLKEKYDKTLWLMVILMFPAVGAVIYLVARIWIKTESGHQHNIL